MPIRINPLQDFHPCILTLESIKQITERIERDFQTITYYATDDIWEIFDEPLQSFLDAVSQRNTLDSFIISAKIGSGENIREIKITFSNTEASVKLSASAQHMDWFEHLLFDIKKSILPPSFNQLTSWVNFFSSSPSAVILAASIMPFRSNIERIMSLRNAPYCRIIIRQKSPNPFVENIKANIVSNIIWVIIVFVFGFVVSLLLTG